MKRLSLSEKLSKTLPKDSLICETIKIICEILSNIIYDQLNNERFIHLSNIRFLEYVATFYRRTDGLKYSFSGPKY